MRQGRGGSCIGSGLLRNTHYPNIVYISSVCERECTLHSSFVIFLVFTYQKLQFTDLVPTHFIKCFIKPIWIVIFQLVNWNLLYPAIAHGCISVVVCASIAPYLPLMLKYRSNLNPNLNLRLDIGHNDMHTTQKCDTVVCTQ